MCFPEFDSRTPDPETCGCSVARSLVAVFKNPPANRTSSQLVARRKSIPVRRACAILIPSRQEGISYLKPNVHVNSDPIYCPAELTTHGDQETRARDDFTELSEKTRLEYELKGTKGDRTLDE